jgi:hypothetical protein
MFDMRRREFITLLGGAAAAWPRAARAQRPAMPMIGLLSPRSPAVDASLIWVIRQGLNDTGFGAAVPVRRDIELTGHVITQQRDVGGVPSAVRHRQRAARRRAARQLLPVPRFMRTRARCTRVFPTNGVNNEVCSHNRRIDAMGDQRISAIERPSRRIFRPNRRIWLFEPGF